MRILVVHPGPNFAVADVFAGYVEALRKLGQAVAVYDLGQRISFYSRALVEMDEPGPGGKWAEPRMTGVDGAHPEPERAKPVRVRKALTYDEALQLAANGVLSTCYQAWPDVVLSISSFFMDPRMLDVMRVRKTKVVLLHTESPYQDPEQLQRSAHADLTFLNDPQNIEKFRELGPVEYLPQAYRPHVHKPGPSLPKLECDFAFVGTAFESRVKFFEAMQFGDLDVLLGGNWGLIEKRESPLHKYLAHDISECLDNEQTVDVYRSAKMGINFYRREMHWDDKTSAAQGWAMGPREVEMAAVGLPFLRDPRGEGDEVLSMEPTFDSPEDALEKLHWWLTHPRTRERVSAQAREAIKDRTFENNTKKILRMLDA